MCWIRVKYPKHRIYNAFVVVCSLFRQKETKKKKKEKEQKQNLKEKRSSCAKTKYHVPCHFVVFLFLKIIFKSSFSI